MSLAATDCSAGPEFRTQCYRSLLPANESNWWHLDLIWGGLAGDAGKDELIRPPRRMPMTQAHHDAVVLAFVAVTGNPSAPKRPNRGQVVYDAHGRIGPVGPLVP
jgi:hypothetical protein